LTFKEKTTKQYYVIGASSMLKN